MPQGLLLRGASVGSPAWSRLDGGLAPTLAQRKCGRRDGGRMKACLNRSVRGGPAMPAPRANGKPARPLIWRAYFGCGGRIRTYDLQVMSLTSYRAAPPRVKTIGKTGSAGPPRGGLCSNRDTA